MNIELNDRASRNTAAPVARRMRVNLSAAARNNAPPTPQMVRDVSRAAGQFQRSAMGHLDHQGWYDRMRHDGQHLMDLLAQMGFSPTEGKV